MTETISKYGIVISHHQAEFLDKFQWDSAVAVFDDPLPADMAALNGRPYVKMPTAGNRGANRNAGLAYWMRHNVPSDSIFEFLDGDRYPVKYSDPGAEMQEYDADILLYPCHEDTRWNTLRPDVPLYMKGPGNPFFSCGFAIRHSAVSTIMEFNGGDFFREEFAGWGGEDQYMGTVAAHLGLKCILSGSIELNGTVGGDSSCHPEYIATQTTYIQLVMRNGLMDTFLDNVGPVSANLH